MTEEDMKVEYEKNPARTELDVDKIERVITDYVGRLHLLGKNPGGLPPKEAAEWLALQSGIPPHLFGRTPDASVTEAESAHNLFLQRLDTIE